MKLEISVSAISRKIKHTLGFNFKKRYGPKKGTVRRTGN
jgi:hypothetical protein